MTLETARSFFLWCSLINYALICVWALLATVGRVRYHALVGRLFPISLAQFDLINYGGIALYKLGVILFNIVPMISLFIIS
jgi:hypothetical protein